MTLAEYIEKYRPKSVNPKLWRGTPPEILKRHLESLFWRLSGYRAMVDLPIEQVKEFLEQTHV
jgi:hypothetical protein